MKKILLFCVCMCFYQSTFALSWGEAILRTAEKIQKDTPESYMYIDLYYTNIDTGSEYESALKKLIYHNAIKNKAIDLPLSKEISSKSYEILQKKAIGTFTESENSLKITVRDSNSNVKLSEKEKILYDVLKTLRTRHVDKGNFSREELLEAAIEGLAKGADDTYTTYFPAIESEDFYDVLEGEYEGIGAYVEMPEPGKLIIVSPIAGSPAEAAGLRGGDRVTHVDGKEITEENNLREVISWIKGPAGTRVILHIERENEGSKKVSVIRKTITLKDVEYEKLERDTYYIQIKNFGERVDTEFREALEAMSKEAGVKKVIIDVRNNPGGFLSEASTVLSYFLEKGATTAIIDSGSKETLYTSLGYDLIDFSEYEIIFLQNSGSASASEIMVGTVKDYFPETIIIGEQSFGKGSVQSLKNYRDGSTLKYTSAKWYTGKNKNGIDGVGITPDIEIEFDRDRFEKYKKDNQLERALSY